LREKEDQIRESLFNQSNNSATSTIATIQAGDPSLMFLSSKRDLDAASLLSLNNDYEKLLEENYTELKLKCLNDLNDYDTKLIKTKTIAQQNHNHHQIKQNTRNEYKKHYQHLTHVDVIVPSSTTSTKTNKKNEFHSSHHNELAQHRNNIPNAQFINKQTGNSFLQRDYKSGIVI
jgi:hypothetical protein